MQEGGEIMEQTRENGDDNNPETDQSRSNETNNSSSSSSSSSTYEHQPSPRGVLESTISSDSYHSFDDSSIELNHGNQQWTKLLNQVKKTTPVKFPTNPLLYGYKAFKKRLGRNRSTEDAIDCSGFVVPKPSWRNFTYDELKQATNGFSSDKLIGKGGHAEVYKGFLSDNQIVAVKKIIKEKKNDEEKVGDFLSELGIIAHIDHQNAAKLIGFSATDRGLHLVLQFSPHGSLGNALHDCEKNLEWSVRYKVAIGVAEGLRYLHYDCPRRVIHRDITASNILLSEDYEAQISDFGLAKWLPESCEQQVVSPIEGTFGYMAPEYFMHGILHEKTDVFAFGVLLLELITGRRAVDSSRQSLVIWAKPHLEKNNVKEIADPRLGESYNIVEMKRAMFAALTCIHHLPDMRPNMKRVVQMLKGQNERIDLKKSSMGGRALLSDTCDLEEYTSTNYLKDLNRHMELVME